MLRVEKGAFTGPTRTFASTGPLPTPSSRRETRRWVASPTTWPAPSAGSSERGPGRFAAMRPVSTFPLAPCSQTLDKLAVLQGVDPLLEHRPHTAQVVSQEGGGIQPEPGKHGGAINAFHRR